MKRIWKILLAVAVVAALALWVRSRWRAWFGNVPEVEFSTALAPGRITLTPGEDFLTQRTVSWRCGSDTTCSSLELAHCADTAVIAATGCVVRSRAGSDAFYHARLSGLKPGESYSYRAITAGHASQWHSFSMPGRSGSRRFLYFGDVQDTIGGESRQWLSKLYERYHDADFWACAGDLVEAPVDKYWNYFFSTAHDVAANVPLVVATGNHDYIKSLYPTIDPRWTHTFSYPPNGAPTARGKSYFFDTPTMRFIVIDTNGISDVLTATGTHTWLERTLADAGSRWKVVMMHHPIHSVRRGRNNVVIRNIVRPLLERYGAHLVLQGHEHGYMRSLGRNDGLPVYVVSFMSPKAYPSREPEEGLKIIAGRRTYQVIDFDNIALTYRAFALDNDSLLDSLTIKR